MTRCPTLMRLHELDVPTLMVVGRRDPLVDDSRIDVVLGPQLATVAVRVDGAHALDFTHPEFIAALIGAHVTASPVRTDDGPLAGVEIVVDGCSPGTWMGAGGAGHSATSGLDWWGSNSCS